MQFEENENFEIVLPRKKKSNTKNTKQLNLDEVRPVRKSSSFHDDEGIGSASPTYESDDHPHQTGFFQDLNFIEKIIILGQVSQPKKKSKPSKKKQSKKNGKKKVSSSKAASNSSKQKQSQSTEEKAQSEANNNNNENFAAAR